RPLLELEVLPAVRILDDDVGPDDVRRHQVRRELDTREGQVEPFGERLDQESLAQARHALEQDVTAGEHPGEHVRDDLSMSDDHLLDLGAQDLEGGDERLNPGILVHRALLSRILAVILANPCSHSIESRQAMTSLPSLTTSGFHTTR